MAVNPVRPNEWQLLRPLVEGVVPAPTMLELGNKKNESVGVSYKDWFRREYGVQHVSVDINGRDGAWAFDLRKPLAPALATAGQPTSYDIVTNIGTTEHVVDQQERVWQNVLEAVRVDGTLVSITPMPGDWCWHGIWYPTAEFYTRLALANDFEIVADGEYGTAPTRCLFIVARKRSALQHYAVPLELLYKNIQRRRV